MSQDRPQFESFKAGVDLSSYEYHIMKISSDGYLDPAGAGDQGIGVLPKQYVEPDAEGKTTALAVRGTAKIKMAATCSIGDEIVPADAVEGTSLAGAGKVNSAADEYVIGKALEAATAVGDVIEVLLMPYQASA